MKLSLGSFFERKKHYSRVIAIGDIHGFYAKLMYLFGKLKVDYEKDLVVFLGDYTDRGPSSYSVMKFVLEHRSKPNMIFLKGNHEAMFYEAFMGSDTTLSTITWGQNGGNTTMDSINASSDTKIIGEWCTFIENMPTYFETEQDGKKFFFCHAGIDTRKQFDQQSEETLLWERKFVKEHTYRGERAVVVGHTPSVEIVPIPTSEYIRPQMLNDGKIILMDTGPFYRGGAVSAMNVLTGEIWQSLR